MSIEAAIYEVTVEETRRVTIRRTMHILATSAESAAAQAEERTARNWAALATVQGVELGPVER